MIRIRALGWLGILRLTVSGAIAGCSAQSQAPSETQASAPAAEQNPVNQGLEVIAVTVASGGERHVFQTEVASTPAEQTRGLMFRESLADDAGMIFPFDPPREASFWMRNTVIPLDMIFIGEGGVILNIEREVEPLTFDSRRSAGPVIAVFEIAGGRAAELGIEAGDHVSWPGGPPIGE